MAIVLMYHNVVEGEAERNAFHPAHRPYVVTRAEFTRQVEMAGEAGWRFLGVEELYGQRRDEKKALFLTFDDTWENHCATEVMEERGIRGLFFLNSGDIGWEGRLGAEEIRGMAQRGHEIGSHGAEHEFLTNLEGGKLEESLGGSKGILEGITGKTVRFLSAPGGRYNGETVKAAREAGYKGIFVSWPGYLGHIEEEFVVRRIAMSGELRGERFAGMLAKPWPLVAWRSVKYRVARVGQRLWGGGKSGAEGHFVPSIRRASRR